LKVAGEEITIEFPNGDARTFLRSYVRRSRSADHEVVPVHSAWKNFPQSDRSVGVQAPLIGQRNRRLPCAKRR